MPKISLEPNSIQIELTAGEASRYGFALNQCQCLRKKRNSDGGLLLELSSIDLTKQSECSEVVALIPQFAISPVSCGCPEPSTLRPADSPSSSMSASQPPDSTQHFSGVSGYHPHKSTFLGPPEETGVAPIISSPGEPNNSSPTEPKNPADIRRRSPLHEASGR
jgi:hypothetical protein